MVDLSIACPIMNIVTCCVEVLEVSECEDVNPARGETKIAPCVSAGDRCIKNIFAEERDWF